MSQTEAIRDHLRQHPSLSAPEAMKLLGVSRTRAEKMMRQERDCGVIVPLPGKYPRRYRIARLAVEP